MVVKHVFPVLLAFFACSFVTCRRLPEYHRARRDIYCDFTEFLDQAIFGSNDETLRSHTLDECKERCVQKGDNCWSFDYVAKSQTCYLSSLNRTTASPGMFGSHHRSDYYEKTNCRDVVPTTPAGPIMQGTVSGGLFECKRSRLGRDYRGHVSQTGTGRECQRWDSVTPHSHDQEDKNFPDGSKAAARNYCRNPDGEPGGPWCYTTDPDVRWEYCKVSVCIEMDYCDEPVNCAFNPCHVECEAHPSATCLPVFCVACHGAFFSGGQQVDCTPAPGPEECKTTELGQEYQGQVSRTGSGRTCQSWNTQSPHKHSQEADNFPEGSLETASNYCRNPDGEAGGPWCYTEETDVRWEYCAIPMC